MPKEKHLEFKVGIFVLAAVLAFTIFIWSINSRASFGKGKTFKIIFEFANGLKKDAPVRVAGVDEGIVMNIELFFDRDDAKTKAAVMVKIRKEIEVPTDSMIMINQLGLLGEKYIEIFPGTNTKSFYQDNAVIIGVNPIAQEIISEKVMSVAKRLDETVAGLSKVLANEKNQEALSHTIQNIGSLTGNLDSILADVKSGKGNLGKFLYDEALYNDLQGMTSELRKDPWKLLYRPK